MILPRQSILKAIANGNLGIDPFEEARVGPTSIDLCLGRVLRRYRDEVIILGESAPDTDEILIDSSEGFRLAPGKFVLGSTLERLRIPADLQGFLDTKGDVARAGIQIHNTDGHIDPGTDHVITLEVTNNNHVDVVLRSELPVCQLYLMQLSEPTELVYRGKYYGQMGPTGYVPDAGGT